VIGAADPAARALGLRPGQAIAHAQALVPDLILTDATPDQDAAGLTRLAAWCLRYSPLVAPDPPDGIWIDIAGSAHLFGGEAKFLDELLAQLRDSGFRGRAAIADTPGAAWAVARYGAEPIVAPGGILEALRDLPVAALRLAPGLAEALARLGIERIGQVAAMPGAPLTRRFGADLRRRLDQALGHAAEPIQALVPAETIHRRLAFAEPIGARDTIAGVAAQLCAGLCEDLARAGLGARRLDLVCHRVDKAAQAVRIGTARPTRDPAHLARLLGDRLDGIDPGFGIEEVRLSAVRVEPLGAEQMGAHELHGDEPDMDLGPLVDRLLGQLGAGRVFRQAPVESDMPERSVARLHPLAPPIGVTWPASIARPLRLLDPPEPVDVLALLPDYPPALFVWRRVRRRVVRSDGPERMGGEWWRSAAEIGTVRDYYRVEDDKGARYWLFRGGPADEGGRWFMHGLFA
jgi:protein ImuB